MTPRSPTCCLLLRSPPPAACCLAIPTCCLLPHYTWPPPCCAPPALYVFTPCVHTLCFTPALHLWSHMYHLHSTCLHLVLHTPALHLCHLLLSTCNLLVIYMCPHLHSTCNQISACWRSRCGWSAKWRTRQARSYERRWMPNPRCEGFRRVPDET